MKKIEVLELINMIRKYGDLREESCWDFFQHPWKHPDEAAELQLQTIKNILSSQKEKKIKL